MTQVIAHRGFSAEFPENTHIAFSAALAYPIDGIETDLQLTADQRVVVFHDRSLSKLGHPHQCIHHLNLEELKKRDIGLWKDARFKGQTILTLEELLEDVGHKTKLLLEIKVREQGSRLRTLGQLILKALGQNEAHQKHEILCFDLELLRFLHGINPQIRMVLNTELDCTSRLTPADWEGLHAISFRIEGISQAAVDRCRAQGKQVYGYTCNQPNQLKHSQAMGLDLVMTDRPHWLLQNLHTDHAG